MDILIRYGKKNRRIKKLKENNIKGIILDVDNTLIDLDHNILEGAEEWCNNLKEQNIKFERVLWYPDAFVIKNANEKDIQKLDIYQKGYIYIQSLPSMVPPLVLAPKENENIF